ncbi:hypothetical protein, partial [Desulfobacula sp.]|uniref:hypothetical protein n=1 Tax=Desulfobacula sp. TaxID=2593537 RepID=UPI00261E2C99
RKSNYNLTRLAVQKQRSASFFCIHFQSRDFMTFSRRRSQILWAYAPLRAEDKTDINLNRRIV